MVSNLLYFFAGFLAYTAWREHQAAKERSEMADRLLARHLPEYQLAQQTTPPPEAQPLTDAMEAEQESTSKTGRQP